MVNMGVVVGLGPITGQPLPLVSMGGTALVFAGISIGIILSASRGEQEENWGQLQSQASSDNKNVEAKAA